MTFRLVAALTLALVSSAWAQGRPVFNGYLKIRPAGGSMNAKTGVSALNIQRWTWTLRPESNGLEPDLEPLIVGIGDTERLVLPAGLLKRSKNGRKFIYRDRTVTRGVRSVRLWRGKSSTVWQVKLQLVGLDLSRLQFLFPDCLPTAVIVGDDDGFSGVEFDLPNGRYGGRVKATGFCETDGEWPWL
ncbi:MAG TPA: hypothetical protein VGR62_21580 [Candidatus Binatia bacterium]|nr:hypothetical protein [Candidatus Binatia bacterium]